MSIKCKRVIEKLLGFALIGGMVSSTYTIPSYASSSVFDGTTTYTLPKLTSQQKQQVNQAIPIVNHAMYQHKTSVTFPFHQAQSFSAQDRTNISVYIYLSAIRLHPEQLQNGVYLAGNLRSTFNNTKYTSSQWTLRLYYNNTAQQDKLAWQKAQSLVQQLYISSDQNTGMKQIYDYCCSSFDYDYALEKDMDAHPTQSYSNLTAYGILCLPNHGQSPKTLCTGYAQVFYLMCRAMGWDNVYVAQSRSHAHMYNAVKTNQGTFIVDSCFGRTYPNRYFMVPLAMAEQIDANHHGTEI